LRSSSWSNGVLAGPLLSGFQSSTDASPRLATQTGRVGAVSGLSIFSRVLPTSDQAKDAEILRLRHQITVLERQLRGQGHRVRALGLSVKRDDSGGA
jgi:hypothetical protein